MSQSFKLGQRVRVRKGAEYNITLPGWQGVVTDEGKDEAPKTVLVRFDNRPDMSFSIWDKDLVAAASATDPATLDDIATLSVGTILSDEKGTIRRVLGIAGEVVFYSRAAHGTGDDEAHSFRFGQTCRELQQRGWTVQGETSVRTISRAEAEAQLGAKIEG